MDGAVGVTLHSISPRTSGNALDHNRVVLAPGELLHDIGDEGSERGESRLLLPVGLAIRQAEIGGRGRGSSRGGGSSGGGGGGDFSGAAGVLDASAFG